MNYVRATAFAMFLSEVTKISEAIKSIEAGICKRVDVNDRIKVYECNNVIRIDIKE